MFPLRLIALVVLLPTLFMNAGNIAVFLFVALVLLILFLFLLFLLYLVLRFSLPFLLFFPCFAFLAVVVGGEIFNTGLMLDLRVALVLFHYMPSVAARNLHSRTRNGHVFLLLTSETLQSCNLQSIKCNIESQSPCTSAAHCTLSAPA